MSGLRGLYTVQYCTVQIYCTCEFLFDRFWVSGYSWGAKWSVRTEHPPRTVQQLTLLCQGQPRHVTYLNQINLVLHLSGHAEFRGEIYQKVYIKSSVCKISLK